MDIIIAPFAWLLNFLASFVNNYGLAVILFALIVKIVLLPFGMKSKKSMMRTSQFQPKLKELEKKYEGNKAKYNEEVAKLYQQEGVKPLGGCLWTLIPFPIMIALYTAIRQPFTKLMNLTVEQFEYFVDVICVKLDLFIESADATYGQIRYAQVLHDNFGTVTDYIAKNANDIANAVGAFSVSDMNFSFIGLDLSQNPSYRFFLDTASWAPADIWPQLGLFLIPIVSAALSFFAAKISQKVSGQDPNAAGGMKGMLLITPLISLWIGFAMPAVMGIYWIANSVFSMVQDIVLTKYYGKILAAEQALRDENAKSKEAELEAKRQETELLRAQNATIKNPNTSKRKIQMQEKAASEKKASERNQTDSKKKDQTDNPSQVGDRKYARGRAYAPDRYNGNNEDSGQMVYPAEDMPPLEDLNEDTQPELEEGEITDVISSSELSGGIETDNSYKEDT